jgi:DNA invertase Pin-like site-specific DNA recombinase
MYIRHMTYRAAIYVRQSRDVQEGIARQLDKCRQLIELADWELVRTFEDNDVSATKPRGPKTAWAEMLRAFDNGEFEVLVAVNLDRLLRAQRDLSVLIERGILIRTVEGEIDLTSAFGEFQASVATSMAAFEVRRKAERQIRANDFRAQRGLPAAGKRVFGWEKDQLTVREEEAKIIRLTFSLFLDGQSLHSICRTLNDSKLFTVSGTEWSVNQLKVMMLRQRNCGRLVRHGSVMETSQISPIVSAEDFDTVKAILTDPSRGSTVGPKPEKNWLTGLMRCGGCGSPMWAKNVRSKTYKTRNYSCSDSLKRRADAGSTHTSIGADVAEEKILMTLYGHFSASAEEVKIEDRTPRLKKIEKQIAERTKVRDAAQELYLNPNANKTIALAEMEKAALDIERLHQERAGVLGSTSEALALAQKISELGDSGDTANEWLKIWSALPLETRRDIIRNTFSIEVIKGGKGAKRVLVSLKDRTIP